MSLELIPNIQQRAEDELPTMRDILDEHSDAGGREAVFIDNTLEYDVAVLSYAEHLAQLLGDEITDKGRSEEMRVAYRAIHFLSLLTGLHGCNRGVTLDPLEAMSSIDNEDVRDSIRQIADDYSEQCPTVMGHVDAYMSEIDPSGKYGYLAETVAGFIGRQIEDGLLAAIAADEVAAWDGMIPDDLMGNFDAA